MRKTLLLVFIHGFKGGDDTFGTFPEHLRALISHALPKVDVVAVAYPRFETRGELKECVARFREWLENKVIDIEVAHSTPSPTVDPSVHTILVGHSMGGIVAAETLLLLAREQPLPSSSSAAINSTSNNTTLNSTTNPTSPPTDPSTSTFMFPHIQGLLAFDTPFLGLNPSMVAHSLEGGGKLASTAYGTLYNDILPAFGWGGAAAGAKDNAPPMKPIAGALPPPPPPAAGVGEDAAAAPKWQSWGKYAMFAGAAGAVAAGGAAALYTQKERISAGWGWASSHLLFVGDLARPELLKKRVLEVEGVCAARGKGKGGKGLGCVNFYTNLGGGAREGYGVTAAVAGRERTFCNLPVKAAKNLGKRKDGGAEEEQEGMQWLRALNEKAKDETSAHMSMFYPRDNPGFYALGQDAKERVVRWVDAEWYEASDGLKGPAGRDFGEVGDDWEEPYGHAGSEGKGKMDGEGTFEHPVEINDDDILDEDHDVKMTDEGQENDDELESSIIVDKAQNQQQRRRSGEKGKESTMVGSQVREL